MQHAPAAIEPILVTAPACYPVTLAEVRQQLGIDTTDYDARLAAMIVTATEMAEDFTNRALISRVYKGFLNRFDCYRRYIDLPRLPLISVSYVKTYDDSDVATTMSASDYFVSASPWKGRITLRTSSSWPNAYRTQDAIEIGWTAGYGSNPADVPQQIRTGIIICVAALNENRGDEGAPVSVPPAAAALFSNRAVNSIA